MQTPDKCRNCENYNGYTHDMENDLNKYGCDLQYFYDNYESIVKGTCGSDVSMEHPAVAGLRHQIIQSMGKCVGNNEQRKAAAERMASSLSGFYLGESNIRNAEKL